MNNTHQHIIIREATIADFLHIHAIIKETEQSANIRGTGIAKRSYDYVKAKIIEGKCVIAVTQDNEWIGFSYIETWQQQSFVSNSGLIVNPDFRKFGIARQIKLAIFTLSRQKYPQAKIFSITTGKAVMQLNTELGFVPTIYENLTNDENFWIGCKSCVNYPILMSKNKKHCMCTALIYDPQVAVQQKNTDSNQKESITISIYNQIVDKQEHAHISLSTSKK